MFLKICLFTCTPTETFSANLARLGLICAVLSHCNGVEDLFNEDRCGMYGPLVLWPMLPFGFASPGSLSAQLKVFLLLTCEPEMHERELAGRHRSAHHLTIFSLLCASTNDYKFDNNNLCGNNHSTGREKKSQWHLAYFAFRCCPFSELLRDIWHF